MYYASWNWEKIKGCEWWFRQQILGHLRSLWALRRIFVYLKHPLILSFVVCVPRVWVLYFESWFGCQSYVSFSSGGRYNLCSSRIFVRGAASQKASEDERLGKAGFANFLFARPLEPSLQLLTPCHTTTTLICITPPHLRTKNRALEWWILNIFPNVFWR